MLLWFVLAGSIIAIFGDYDAVYLSSSVLFVVGGFHRSRSLPLLGQVWSLLKCILHSFGVSPRPRPTLNRSPVLWPNIPNGLHRPMLSDGSREDGEGRTGLSTFIKVYVK